MLSMEQNGTIIDVPRTFQFKENYLICVLQRPFMWPCRGMPALLLKSATMFALRHVLT